MQRAGSAEPRADRIDTERIAEGGERDDRQRVARQWDGDVSRVEQLEGQSGRPSVDIELQIVDAGFGNVRPHGEVTQQGSVLVGLTGVAGGMIVSDQPAPDLGVDDDVAVPEDSHREPAGLLPQRDALVDQAERDPLIDPRRQHAGRTEESNQLWILAGRPPACAGQRGQTKPEGDEAGPAQELAPRQRRRWSRGHGHRTYPVDVVEHGSGPTLELTVNGHRRVVADSGGTLLDLLREELGLTSAKDGCSPQGQCGCCTVLVDGGPRVACVTPARRVRGRSVTTIEGLDEDRRAAWADAFVSVGASQCGFCTPGIIMRLDAIAGDRAHAGEIELDQACRRAMLAHVCRCTGWQTISEAFVSVHRRGSQSKAPVDGAARRHRIKLESGGDQVMSGSTALGGGGFAADTVPQDALVAVLDNEGRWVVGERLSEARRRAGKVQGRRSTVNPAAPVEMPDGDFVAMLQTAWVDPAYLETDASWCEPGGRPSTPLANGGAFGAKTTGEIEQAARRLADRHGRPVVALYSREDALRLGPKRPPVAGGIRADGSGVIRLVRTPGAAEIVNRFAPRFEVEEVDVPGPPTSTALRAAVWAELAVLQSALGDRRTAIRLTGPSGAVVTAQDDGGHLVFTVAAGPALDPVVLRSYCIGAVHMGWSWATSEAMAVDESGVIHDLTVRSLGVLRAVDTPPIRIEVVEDPAASEPVNAGDTVFAAAAALAWRTHDFAPRFPLGSGLRLP